MVRRRQVPSGLAPEVDLFVTDQQRAVAEICAAKGASVDRDQVVYLLSRSERWKRIAGDAAELYAVMEGNVVLDPWRELEALREIAAQRALRRSPPRPSPSSTKVCPWPTPERS